MYTEFIFLFVDVPIEHAKAGCFPRLVYLSRSCKEKLEFECQHGKKFH